MPRQPCIDSALNTATRPLILQHVKAGVQSLQPEPSWDGRAFSSISVQLLGGNPLCHSPGISDLGYSEYSLLYTTWYMCYICYTGIYWYIQPLCVDPHISMAETGY